MIGIIDYGAGNTKSIINALERLNTTYFLSENSEKLMNADKLILPGVGHAKVAMRQLEKQHLVDFIKNWKKSKITICSYFGSDNISQNCNNFIYGGSLFHVI